MFRFFHDEPNQLNLANTLTALSGHYVDWSRVGELIKSGAHRYTSKELITRGLIVSCTAVSAYLGNYSNNEELTHCSNLAVSIAAGMIGFTLSHTVVILPLLHKRYQRKLECDRLIAEVESLTSKELYLVPYREEILATVDSLLRISLSDEQHSKASETWGRRERLLSNFLECLKNKDTNFEWFFEREVASIIADLGNDSSSASEVKGNFLAR